MKGLQTLIDICRSYATQWRFTYGHNKSKCMIIGKGDTSDPGDKTRWTLGANYLDTVKRALLGLKDE